MRQRDGKGVGWLDSQGHLNKHKPDAEHVEHVCEHETGVWISAFSNMFTAHGADRSDYMGCVCMYVFLYFYLCEDNITYLVLFEG